VLEALTALLLAGHLLAMNLASAGPLLAIFLHRHARRDPASPAADVGARLAWRSLAALVLGIALGFALLGLEWLRPESRYLTAVAAFPAKRYWYALAELACSLLWLGLYAGLWWRLARFRVLHASLAVLSSTNLMYHFPPLLAAIALVAARGEVAETLGGMTTIGWLRNAEIASRSVHFWLASFAVAGVYLMHLAAGSLRRGGEQRALAPLGVWGARLALTATVLQLPVGTWVLFSLPAGVQSSLLGGNLLASGSLGLAIVLALWLLHLLAAVALGEFDEKTARSTGLLMTVLVVVMSITLREARYEAPPAAAVAAPTARLAG